MLCDTNYLTASLPAFEAVQRLLGSPEGNKISKKIGTVDIVDFLFNENGYDRYSESMPESKVYESIITHFSLFLTDIYDIDAMRLEVEASLSNIRPEGIPEDHKILPSTRKAIEYVFLMIYRKLFIAGVLPPPPVE